MLRHRVAASFAATVALILGGVAPALADSEVPEAEGTNATCEAGGSHADSCAGDVSKNRDDKADKDKDHDRDKNRDKNRDKRDDKADRDKDRDDKADRDKDRDEKADKDRDRDKDRDDKADRDKDRDDKAPAPVPKAVAAGVGTTDSNSGPAGTIGLLAAAAAIATGAVAFMRRRLLNGS